MAGVKKAKAPHGQSRCKALTANGVQSNAVIKDNYLPGNLKELAALKMMEIRAKYPNVPEHALTKPKPYNDSKANGLTGCIIDAINLSGGQAERISNTGRVIDNSYTYTDVIGKRKTIGGVKFIPGT
ncbi:hypothetical protein, partial [Echinicola sediminis]